MIEIIGALARNARVILLDEPTTALERSQIDRLVEALRRIAREQGVAIVIVDHKLDEIFAVCDRITVLTDGRVVLDAPIATVHMRPWSNPSSVRKTRQGCMRSKSQPWPCAQPPPVKLRPFCKCAASVRRVACGR